MTELDDADNQPANPPLRGEVVLISDTSADGERIVAELRERGLTVITAPLALLEARVLGEAPQVVIIDVDQPGAFEAIERMLEFSPGAAATLICLGNPHRAAEIRALGAAMYTFHRPVDIEAVVARVLAHTDPGLYARRTQESLAPSPPSSRPDTAPPPTHDSETPEPSEFSINQDPFDLSLIIPSIEDPIATTAMLSTELSPELEQLMLAADRRVGTQVHASTLPPPDEDGMLLSPEMLAVLDEPLEMDDEEARTGSDGSNRTPGQAPLLSRMTGNEPQAGAVVRSPLSDPAEVAPSGDVESMHGARGSGRQGQISSGSYSSPAHSRERTMEDAPSTTADQLPSLQITVVPSRAASSLKITDTSHELSSRPQARPARAPLPGMSQPVSSGNRLPLSSGASSRPLVSGSVGSLSSAEMPTPPPRRIQPAPLPNLPLAEVGRLQSSSQVTSATRIDPSRSVRAAPTYPELPYRPPPAPPREASPTPRARPAPEPARSPQPAPPAAPAPPRAPPPPIPAALGEGDAAIALAHAIAGRATGSLAFKVDSGVRRIVLQDGDIMIAASSAEDETLLAFLTARGEIERDIGARFSGKLPPFGRHAGAALIAHGHLGQDDLWPVLRAHAEWIIGRAMLAPSGTCELEPEPPGRLKAEPNVFGGATGAEVFVETLKRVMAPDVAMRRIGGSTARLSDGPRPALLGECALRRGEEDLLRSSQSRTVGELVEASEPEIVTVIYALACLGVVELLAPAAPEGEKEPVGVDPLDEEAVRQRIRARLALVEDGDYFSLLGIARGATSYEIRRAYLELRRAFEPTRLLTAAMADMLDDVRLVIEVLDEAYEILREPHRRARYRKAIESPAPE